MGDYSRTFEALRDTPTETAKWWGRLDDFASVVRYQLFTDLENEMDHLLMAAEPVGGELRVFRAWFGTLADTYAPHPRSSLERGPPAGGGLDNSRQTKDVTDRREGTAPTTDTTTTPAREHGDPNV